MSSSKKHISALTTSGLLLLTLSTTGMAQPGDVLRPGDNLRQSTRRQEAYRPADSEKIGVRIDGSRLIVSVAGKPGRFCGIFCEAPGMKRYQADRKSVNKIGGAGRVDLVMDLRNQEDGILTCQVFTDVTGEFKDSVRGTEPFQVTMTRSKIVSVGRIGGMLPSVKVNAQVALASGAHTEQRRGAAAATIGSKATRMLPGSE